MPHPNNRTDEEQQAYIEKRRRRARERYHSLYATHIAVQRQRLSLEQVNLLRDKSRAYQRRKVEALAARARPESCECCGDPPMTKGLAFDHCHATGKFRGWLCSRCNLGLGYAKDSIDRLRMMIKYLEGIS